MDYSRIVALVVDVAARIADIAVVDIGTVAVFLDPSAFLFASIEFCNCRS